MTRAAEIAATVKDVRNWIGGVTYLQLCSRPFGSHRPDLIEGLSALPMGSLLVREAAGLILGGFRTVLEHDQILGLSKEQQKFDQYSYVGPCRRSSETCQSAGLSDSPF